MNTVKAFVLHDKCMSVDPDKLRVLLGDGKTVKEEVKYRSRPLGCWRSYLFWLMAIISFFAFLYLLDLLA